MKLWIMKHQALVYLGIALLVVVNVTMGMLVWGKTLFVLPFGVQIVLAIGGMILLSSMEKWRKQ